MPITFVNSALTEPTVASTTLTVTLPANLQPGDLMLVYIKNTGSAVATPPNAPDGWAFEMSATQGNYFHLFSKRYVANDASPQFVMPVSSKHHAQVVVYRDVGSWAAYKQTVNITNGTDTATMNTVNPVEVPLDNSVVVWCRDCTTTAVTGSYVWSAGANERTDSAYVYASGLTNIMTIGDVEVPNKASIPTVTNTVTGDVSGSTNRTIGIVLRPPYVSNYDPPTFLGITVDETSGGSRATLNATVPAGATVGDVMVLTVRTTSATVSATPAGWTLLGSAVRTSGSLIYMYWKFVSQGDSTFPIALSAANAAHSAVVHAYRNAAGVDSFASATGTATVLAMPTINTTLENSVVMYTACSGITGTGAAFVFDWASATERFESSIVANSARYGLTTAGDVKMFPSTNTPVTVTTNLSGSTARTGVVVQPKLRPVSARSFFSFFT